MNRLRRQRRTYNKGLCTTGADGSCGSAVAASLSSSSGMTSNAELSTNHQHLFIFSSSVSRADGSNIPQQRKALVVVGNAITPF